MHNLFLHKYVYNANVLQPKLHAETLICQYIYIVGQQIAAENQKHISHPVVSS